MHREGGPGLRVASCDKTNADCADKTTWTWGTRDVRDDGGVCSHGGVSTSHHLDEVEPDDVELL